MLDWTSESKLAAAQVKPRRAMRFRDETCRRFEFNGYKNRELAIILFLLRGSAER